MLVCLAALICARATWKYCDIVSWSTLCWGYLAKDIHVPLPSCSVLRIRKEYSSQDYGGFYEVQE